MQCTPSVVHLGPPPAPPAAHGGVLYVGPGLTRSLLGVAFALSRGTA